MKFALMPALAGLFLLVFGLAHGIAMAPPAQAQNTNAPFGCGCIHNNTQHTVKYRYRWGDGDWRPASLNPNYQQAICWRYESGSTSSPNLTFQIDVDLSNGAAWTTYALPRVQSSSNTCEAVTSRQHHYDISYKPNTNRQYLQMTHRQ